MKLMESLRGKFKKRSLFYVLLPVILIMIGWFYRAQAGSKDNFTYTLEQLSLKPEQELTINNDQEMLRFSTSFRSGGGSFEKAKLVKQGSVYKVMLLDTDNKVEEMIVSYDLSGKISGIPKGEYVLQIASGNEIDEEKVLAEKDFEVK